MSIQDMKDLKQKYLDEIKNMINQIQIKYYRNERIDISHSWRYFVKDDRVLISLPLTFMRKKFVTFSNPLFDSNDDFTFIDDESLSDEDISGRNVKNLLVTLFVEFDDEYNLYHLLVLPLSDANEDECFNPGGEIDEIDAFLDTDISTDIENGYYDSEGGIIYLESLLINDHLSSISLLK
ncbi:hypothetical protein Tco_1068787 [Tanacetum coccineum]|uniref:Uncharacterized protein n=1 Tax=Tanacetum coccineum TaxID=301880 RepID=A0ABQ5HH47_9ASTR